MRNGRFTKNVSLHAQPQQDETPFHQNVSKTSLYAVSDSRSQRKHDSFSAQGERVATHAPQKQPKKPRKPRFVKRTVNAWWDRLLGAVADGSFGGQEEEYAAHRTSRDYLWNTVGFAVWGMVFPVLTIVVTQLMGVEAAGMFSLAFVAGTLFMIIANYGVRTYQVSDINEEHSFADYQVNRFITCIIMMLVGLAYCYVRGYGSDMMLMSIGVYLYKMVDGLGDVYEGRLQQKDKLYLAGISLTLRSLAALVVFSFVLLLFRSLVAASIAMAIAAFLVFLVLTFPLALFETSKSRRVSSAGVFSLFRQCFPLFAALFLYALVDNMPKFVMEGALPYDNQLYFNALYFPAQAILLTVGFIYKPQLVRMANAWADVEHRKRFDLFIIVMLAVIVGITVGGVVVMNWIGIPIMSFMYGIDFERFTLLSFIMLAAGGVTAAIDFLYQIITILRRQKIVTELYLITFGLSFLILILLVNEVGLDGAVIGYLVVMTVLLALLLREYIRVRIEYARHPEVEKEVQPQSEVPVREKTGIRFLDRPQGIQNKDED